MTIYLTHKVQIALLKIEKAPVTIPAEYLDFANVFSENLAMVLPKHTEIDIYVINLEKDKKLYYRFIHSLDLVELKTLKTYIETNLMNSFICLFKSSTDALILLDQKSDGSFYFYVNY